MEKAKKRKFLWSAAGEELLCELWREKIVELRGTRKNGHIFKDIAESLGESGLCVSSEEVRTKINNLTGRYRKEKGKVGVSGGTPSEWPLYRTVHEILGSFKCNNIEELIEESIDYVAIPPTSTNSLADSSLSNCSESPVVPQSPLSECAGCSKKNKQRDSTGITRELMETKELLKEIAQEERETDAVLISIEERRNELLEKFVTSSEGFQKSLLEILNKK